MAANQDRGEVEGSVGGRRLKLVVTMDGLARFSAAIGSRKLADMHERLGGCEPVAVLAAVEHWSTDRKVALAAIQQMRPAELFAAQALAVAAFASAFAGEDDEPGNADAAAASR